jgi:hypothetical protein
MAFDPVCGMAVDEARALLKEAAKSARAARRGQEIELPITLVRKGDTSGLKIGHWLSRLPPGKAEMRPRADQTEGRHCQVPGKGL